jgi:hypothetical protein
VEVPIGKYSVESVGISISGLIEEDDGLDDSFIILELGLEDIGNLRLRLGSEADGCSIELLGGWLVDEIAVDQLCLEGRVGQDMAGGGLPNFGESKNGKRFLEDLEERDIACFDCFEKILCLLLGCLRGLHLHSTC